MSRIAELWAASGKVPKYMPTDTVAVLGYLVEEMGEVDQVVGKVLRHGLSNRNPTVPVAQQETNREQLLRELQDLKLAIAIAEAKLDETGEDR